MDECKPLALGDDLMLVRPPTADTAWWGQANSTTITTFFRSLPPVYGLSAKRSSFPVFLHDPPPPSSTLLHPPPSIPLPRTASRHLPNSILFTSLHVPPPPPLHLPHLCRLPPLPSPPFFTALGTSPHHVIQRVINPRFLRYLECNDVASTVRCGRDVGIIDISNAFKIPIQRLLGMP